MGSFVLPVQIRWSDLDPNFHIKHAVYYEWGALCRMEFLRKNGIPLSKMQELEIGPILFREECIFKKEVKLENQVTIGLQLLKAKKDFSRWSVKHEIKKENEILAAVLSVDIAWMSRITRRLAVLPAEYLNAFENIPKADGFHWLD